MKSCPVCQHIYTDETMRFCLQDGSLLRDEEAARDPSPTLVLPVAEDTPAGSGEMPTEVLEGRALADAIVQRLKHSRPDEAASPPVVESRPQQARLRKGPPHRDTIFISYSHHDREWLEQFQIFLKPHFRHDEISAWDDRQIQPGTKWFDEIDSALNSACVAVLLVTPHFFDSEFIQNVELPRLEEAARTDGLQILWVAVRASAVGDTEIGQYQGLNNPARPLANMSPAEQDAKLVEICKEIKRRARPIVLSQPVEGLQGASVPLVPLRAFDVHMADISLCVPDAQGRLWIANSQQVKIFEVKQEKPAENRLLPKKNWKHHLQAIWRNQLIISDWDGSLYQFSGQGNVDNELLFQARPDDLPIHRLMVSMEGRLIAARWDGAIKVWDADGSMVDYPSTIVVPHLPLQLIPLKEKALAVVDQANYLSTYDAEGESVWKWRAPGVIKSAWACTTDAQRPTFIMQVGRDRLIKMVEGEAKGEEIRFDEPIKSLSRSRSRSGEEWVVVAREGGQIDWLSTSLFSIVRDNSARLDFDVQDIFSISDPEQLNSLIALGLTSEGQPFSVNEHETILYETPFKVERLVVDLTGRFLFFISGNKVAAYRNPAILPSRCQVEIAEAVRGKLEVDAFKKLTVKLKNTGLIPIHQIKAELASAIGIIDAAKSKPRQVKPVLPGEFIELEFSVRAKVHGDLVLDLKVELTDEGGPPFSIVEQSFNVESVAARSGHDGE